MRKKTEHVITVSLFCAFLAVMSLLFIFLPKADFSQLEKRFLSEVPEINAEKIASGEFGEDVESYMADHIPARDFFVGLNAYFELITGRQPADDIYVTEDSALVEAPVAWNQPAMDKNMAAINRFAAAVNKPVDFLVVPSAGWASRNSISGLSKPYNDAEFISTIYGMAGENVRPLDFSGIFDDPSLYYKTDHHWNSEGAYKAYEAYADFLGKEYRHKDGFSIETVAGFHGSTYSRSALWLTKSEELELWSGAENITVTNGESDKTNNGVFYRERLSETDKYTVYLDGNHSLVRLNNPDAKGKGTLLVVRDSYSNCLGGFLAESFENVILVDLRYYKQPVSQLCEEESVDSILVCYSLSNFMTDANVIWLK